MRSMFVGAQVAVEGERWMVHVCLVILYLSRRDSLLMSAFNVSLTLHLPISHLSRESFIKALSRNDDDDDDLYFALFTLNLHYICRSKL